MKKGLLKFAFGLMALLSFVACSSSDSGDNAYRIYVSPSNLNIPYDGGSEIVTVHASLGNNAASWKVSSNSTDFVNISPTTGNGNTNVTITVDKNEDSWERSGYVMFETMAMDFKNGGDSYTLDIFQEANPGSNISVTTNEPSEINTTSVALNGSISGANGYVEVGFYYGTSLYALNSTSSTKRVGNGKFEITVDGLSTGTKYYCQAFAKEGSKIFKSESTSSFTTLEYLLSVWPESMSFSYEGGKQSGGVTAYAGDYKYKSTWTISRNTANFVKISPESGTGYTEFTVTADKNETDKERSGYIEFKNGDKTYTMYISQEAKPNDPFTKDSFGDDIKL